MSILYRRATGLTAELFAANVENGVQYYTESGGSYTMVGAGDEFDPGETYYTKISSSNLTTLKDAILAKISDIGRYANNIWAVLTSEGVPGLVGRKLKDLAADVVSFFTGVDNLVGDPNIAQYTVYTYTMDGAGDYTSPVVTVHAGLFGEVTSVDSATLEAGYSYDTTHAGYNATGVVNEDGSTVFTVYIKRNYYTLTLNLGDGYLMVDGVRYTGSYDIPILYGSIVYIGTYTPALEGYTFTRWQGVPFYMPAADTTATAQYTINTYRARFYQEDGTLWRTTTSIYGQPINVPNDPTKTGYTFTGWDPAIPQTTPASDTDYYMTWSVNSYTLTINYVTEDGDTAPPTYTSSLPYGTEYSITSPDLTGYTPDVATVSGAMDSTSGKTITVTYYLNTYNVTWDVEGELTVQQVKYKVVPTPIPVVVPDSMRFRGWEPTIIAQPDYDMTYVAIIEIRRDIAYKMNVYYMNPYSGDYNNSPIEHTLYGYDGEVIDTEEVATEQGWLSEGLYFDSEHPGCDLSGVVSVETRTVLNIYLGRTEYQLTFMAYMYDMDVQLYYESIRQYSVRYGDMIDVFTPDTTALISKNGGQLQFVEWITNFSDVFIADQYGFYHMPHNDVIVDSRYDFVYTTKLFFNGGTYTYTGDHYSYDGISRVLTVKGIYGQTIPITVSKTGYTFDHWSPAFDGKFGNENAAPGGDPSLKIDPNTYSAIFTSSSPVSTSYRIYIYNYYPVDDVWRMWDSQLFNATSGTTINVWDNSWVQSIVDGSWKTDPRYSDPVWDSWKNDNFYPYTDMDGCWVSFVGDREEFLPKESTVAPDGTTRLVACFYIIPETLPT